VEEVPEVLNLGHGIGMTLIHRYILDFELWFYRRCHIHIHTTSNSSQQHPLAATGSSERPLR
jgi:hypothetical protein